MQDNRHTYLSRGLIFTIIAVLMTLGLRWPLRDIFLYNVDEAVSAVVGQTIHSGGHPYHNSIDHRGPLTYYAYAAIIGMKNAEPMPAIHGAYAILIAGLCVLIWLAVRRWADDLTGGIAALLLAAWSWSGPPMDLWAAHTEWLLIAGTLLGVWLLPEKARPLPALLAGITVGLAALSKQVAVWDAAALGIFLLFRTGKPDFSPANLLTMAAFTLGCLLPPGLFMGYAGMHHFLDEAIFYVWTYNTRYYLPEVDLSERIAGSVAMLGGLLGNKPLAPAAALFLYWQFRPRSGSDPAPGLLLLICWLTGSTLGALTGGRSFVHYGIQMLPALCWAGAWVLGWLWHQGSTHPGLRVLTVLLAAASILTPILGTRVQTHVYIREALEAAPSPVAQYLAGHTQPDEGLFVWGFCPELYVETGLRPASRYGYTNVLTGLIPWENLDQPDTRYAIPPGVRDTLMQELTTRPPKYIVDTAPADWNYYGRYPLTTFSALDSFIHAHYQADTVFRAAFPACKWVLYHYQP
ncbi:MAG: hypothetical protein SF053_10725 [Bacteroidia bacterium]|nr:hypothetical protein [Bacteroidia bacterium]